MIVVVKKNGVACIGGDQYVSTSAIQKIPPQYVVNTEKILHVGTSYLGTDGGEAIYWTLKRYFQEKKSKSRLNSSCEIFEEFLGLHRVLRDEYLLRLPAQDDGPLEPLGFHTLIANQHGIFGAFSSHAVIEYSKFYAVGRGSDYALGALEALYEKEESPERLVQAALEVVSQFEIESGPPGRIYSVRQR